MDMTAFRRPDAEATGRRIRDLLKAEGIKVCDAADKLLVTPNAIYKWQKGNLPDIDNLYRLSKLLDTKVSDILVCREPARASDVCTTYDVELYSYSDVHRMQGKRLICYAQRLSSSWGMYLSGNMSA